MSFTWIKDRRIPLIVFIICAIIPIASSHFVYPMLNDLSILLLKWGSYIVNFALILGIYSVLRSHLNHIKKRTSGQWYLSIFLIFMLFLMLGSGFVHKPTYQWLFDTLWLPLSITIYSFVSFQSFTIMYSGYQLRNFNALVLLVSMICISFIYLPVLEIISPIFPAIGNWVNSYPNMGAQRGLLIGIGIGLVATALRTILGKEKAVFGGD